MVEHIEGILAMLCHGMVCSRLSQAAVATARCFSYRIVMYGRLRVYGL